MPSGWSERLGNDRENLMPGGGDGLQHRHGEGTGAHHHNAQGPIWEWGRVFRCHKRCVRLKGVGRKG